jgi:hypothetical protein
VDHSESSRIYRAWEQIYHALLEAMKPLPRQTLAFFANRASDGIIRSQAPQVLDIRSHRSAKRLLHDQAVKGSLLSIYPDEMHPLLDPSTRRASITSVMPMHVTVGSPVLPRIGLLPATT